MHGKKHLQLQGMLAGGELKMKNLFNIPSPKMQPSDNVLKINDYLDGEQFELTVYPASITPSQAEEFLANSIGNRQYSEAAIDRMADAMLKMEFFPLYDLVRFTKDGLLGDGHHRMKALIKADFTMHCLIAEGYPAKAFLEFDQVKPRTAAQTLKILKAPYAGLMAQVLKIWYQKLENKLNREVPRNLTVIQLLELHPGFKESAAASYIINKEFRAPRAEVTVMHYVGKHLFPSVYQKVFEVLDYGDPSIMKKRLSPMRKLREQFSLEFKAAMAKDSNRQNPWTNGAAMVWIYETMKAEAAGEKIKDFTERKNWGHLEEQIAQAIKVIHLSQNDSHLNKMDEAKKNNLVSDWANYRREMDKIEQADI